MIDPERLRKFLALPKEQRQKFIRDRLAFVKGKLEEIRKRQATKGN